MKNIERLATLSAMTPLVLLGATATVHAAPQPTHVTNHYDQLEQANRAFKTLAAAPIAGKKVMHMTYDNNTGLYNTGALVSREEGHDVLSVSARATSPLTTDTTEAITVKETYRGTLYSSIHVWVDQAGIWHGREQETGKDNVLETTVVVDGDAVTVTDLDDGVSRFHRHDAYDANIAIKAMSETATFVAEPVVAIS